MADETAGLDPAALAELEARADRGELLAIWHVYDSPADYPGMFVARKSVITPGAIVNTAAVYVAADLATVRSPLERLGLYRMPRSEGDEPHIVETWM